MKITSTKFFAIFLFAALAAAPVFAQTNTSATPATSNAPIAAPAVQSLTDDSSVADPAPPKPEHKKKKSSNDWDGLAQHLGISPI
ncbi:MAG: hypothetical protein RLZZ350_2177 [Verrucomicrobiota bacterium]